MEPMELIGFETRGNPKMSKRSMTMTKGNLNDKKIVLAGNIRMDLK